DFPSRGKVPDRHFLRSERARDRRATVPAESEELELRPVAHSVFRFARDRPDVDAGRIGRGQALAVRAEGDGRNPVTVTQAFDALQSLCIPQLDGFTSLAEKGDALAVGTEGRGRREIA